MRTGYWMLGIIVVLVCGITGAATPPDLINYQGVLRDASDSPVDGTLEMFFRLYDSDGGVSCVGGTLLLTDTHSGADDIEFTNGLFNVQIGSGVITPGAVSTLTEAFRDYAAVWVEVQVEGEILCPRIRVASSAYSLNSSKLDGEDAGFYLNTSSTSQVKLGTIYVTSSVPGQWAFNGQGPAGGGRFLDSDGTGYALVGYGDTGIEAFGSFSGGYFDDTNGTGFARIAYGDSGIHAEGSDRGGYFKDQGDNSIVNIAWGQYGVHSSAASIGGLFYNQTGTGDAYVGSWDTGIDAAGSYAGGYFSDEDDTGEASVGYGNLGIDASGSEAGGHFTDSDGSGVAHLGYGNRGIQATGSEAGGYFTDSDGSGYAYLGYGDYGIEAMGNTAGGYYKDRDGTGFAYIGYGPVGVHGEGNTAGGYFRDANSLGWAYVGRSTKGLEAHGTTIGGEFLDDDNTGRAYVAYGNRGIDAWGSEAGGYFYDEDGSGEAYVGYGNTGIDASGDYWGGYFHNTSTNGYAYVGLGDTGIEAYGTNQGGYFADTDGSYVRAGFSTYKILGTGNPSFIQNHPYDNEKVIVYSAPEGDEVATYTRGSARLTDGRVTVPLGETFKWVTNPSIGLTAHLTPRGDRVVLAVEALSTSELVVRGPDGSTAEFDYIVYGLRIGFEEVSIVQEKDLESYIPSMNDHRELYDRRPELREFNSLERFTRMHEALGRGKEIDLSASIALRDAIGEFDPEIHSLMLNRPMQVSRQAEGAVLESQETVGAEEALDRPMGGSVVEAAREGPAPGVVSTPFPIGGEVEAGDVLVLDESQPGALRPADTAGDRTVVGVAVAEASEIDGRLQVEVALHGVVDLKVDAAYGAIMPGDLLTTSPTPGHGMLAIAPAQGSVAAKALERFEYGTGTIRALVIHQ